jgi:pseudouridine synthase
MERLADIGLLRLDRLLSNLGHCSRGSCSKWLRQNRVRIADRPALAPKAHVDPTSVTVNGCVPVMCVRAVDSVSLLCNLSHKQCTLSRDLSCFVRFLLQLRSLLSRISFSLSFSFSLALSFSLTLSLVLYFSLFLSLSHYFSRLNLSLSHSSLGLSHCCLSSPNQELKTLATVRHARLDQSIIRDARSWCSQCLFLRSMCSPISPPLLLCRSRCVVLSKSLLDFSHGLEPLSIILNKPPGYVCSRADEGKDHPLIYSLLPKHFYWRRPFLVPAGRLDKYATGLVVLSQEGSLIHRLTAPRGKRNKMEKVYDVVAKRPFRGDEPMLFSSGELRLRGEPGKPCLPANLEFLDHELLRAR